MENRRVLVQNMSNATVSIIFPNSNFTRMLKGEGAKTYIPFDVLYEGISEPGMDVLFDEGYLYIPDEQDRIDLGIENDFDEENIEDKMMSSADILTVLNEGNAVKIKAMLDNLAASQKEKVAKVAIDNKITTHGVCQLIKNATGIDVIRVVSEQDEDELDK